MTRTAPVWLYAEVNPATPEFKTLDDGTEVSFMPLEAVWPGEKADYAHTLPWSSKQSYSQFRRGDILVPKITPTFEAGRTIIAEIPSALGLASTEVHVVRPNASSDPRFLQYCFQSLPFLDEGAHSLQGVGNLRRITPRFVQEHKVLDATLDTQRAIADYLDRETGEIDAMIAKMDELAEELRQRRQNAITESFESRMANTAPIWSFADVRPSNVDKKSKPDELAVRLVNYTDVYYSKVITPELDLMIATASDEHLKRFAVLPGDVIITKDSEGPDDIGVPAIIERSDADMVCAYHLTLLRPYRDKCHPKYLFWAFESKPTKDYWLTASFGVTRYSIGAGVISRLPIPDLPLDEQRRIADHLDEVTGKIDAMLAKVAELKSLLIERRAALITDVVTGRKAVA